MLKRGLGIWRLVFPRNPCRFLRFGGLLDKLLSTQSDSQSSRCLQLIGQVKVPVLIRLGVPISGRLRVFPKTKTEQPEDVTGYKRSKEQYFDGRKAPIYKRRG
jgi:hypothetical protein